MPFLHPYFGGWAMLPVEKKRIVVFSSGASKFTSLSTQKPTPLVSVDEALDLAGNAGGLDLDERDVQDILDSRPSWAELKAIAAQGGSGFYRLALDARPDGWLYPWAEISAVVSSRRDGSVNELAKQLGVEFVWFSAKGDWAEQYQIIVRHYRPHVMVLVGWLLRVVGLDWGNPPVINTHPGPLPETAGMYGIKLHEWVLASGRSETAVTVHFVDDGLDTGQVILRYPIPLRDDETPRSLQERVKLHEHYILSRVVGYVLYGGRSPIPPEKIRCPIFSA
ncbi:MAG: formyltransferase family protein [bacterium]